jgi:hypothetical protein
VDDKALNGRKISEIENISPNEFRAMMERLDINWRGDEWHDPGESFEADAMNKNLACDGLPDACDVVSKSSSEDLSPCPKS